MAGPKGEPGPRGRDGKKLIMKVDRAIVTICCNLKQVCQVFQERKGRI